MATISKRGDKYRVRYDAYENGQRKQRNKSFNKAKDAKAFAAEVEHELQTGTYANAGKITVEAYLDQYFVTYCAHMRPNTKTAAMGYMKKHIIPSVGQMRLKDLTTLQIQQIYNKMLITEFKAAKYKTINKEEVLISPAKTYSPKTIKNVHGVLSTALNKAVKTNLLMHNPCDNITLPKSKSFEYIIPERDELKSIIDAIKDTELYEAILTCAILGIRRSEVMGLYWSDIDFEEKKISINRSLIYVEETHRLEIGELKTESSHRTLPAPDVLLDTLSELYKRNVSNEMKQASPLIFTNELGNPVRPAKLTRLYKQSATKAGFPKMRLHDLRHTVVTYLIESGQSPKTVQEFVGHTDARFTLKQYAHVINESKRKSSQVISDLYFGK